MCVCSRLLLTSFFVPPSLYIRIYEETAALPVCCSMRRRVEQRKNTHTHPHTHTHHAAFDITCMAMNTIAAVYTYDSLHRSCSRHNNHILHNIIDKRNGNLERTTGLPPVSTNVERGNNCFKPFELFAYLYSGLSDSANKNHPVGKVGRRFFRPKICSRRARPFSCCVWIWGFCSQCSGTLTDSTAAAVAPTPLLLIYVPVQSTDFQGASIIRV